MAVLGVVLLRVRIIERGYFGRHAGTRLVRRFWPFSFLHHGKLLSPAAIGRFPIAALPKLQLPPWSPFCDWPWVQQPSEGRDNPRAVAQLMEVCAGCPVRRECLVQALSEHRLTVGVFGGTTTDRTRILPLSNRRDLGPRFGA